MIRQPFVLKRLLFIDKFFFQEEFVLKDDQLFLYTPESLEKEYDDMVKIDDLNEPVLLHNLSKRYTQDKIYVSSIKISQISTQSLNTYTPNIK